MKNFKHNIYSQNGENGIIDEVIRRIDMPLKVAIEFGAPTKSYCSNIYHLEERGWKCYFYDDNPQEEGVINAFIDIYNINDLTACDIISIDVDGGDYLLWQWYYNDPILVIIEINSSLDPNEDYFDPRDGCNFSLMNKLAEEKDYTLLCHTGNCIYIRNDYAHLFPDADKTFDTTWLSTDSKNI